MQIDAGVITAATKHSIGTKGFSSETYYAWVGIGPCSQWEIGFASCWNWTRSYVLILGNYISSDEAFLFSLRNQVGRKAFKMAVKERGRAMYSWHEYGPKFGADDLFIKDNCHTNTGSYSRLGRSYELPDDNTFTTDQAKHLLAGSFKFKCNEYEVFIQQ